jgi:hypothetical protein
MDEIESVLDEVRNRAKPDPPNTYFTNMSTGIMQNLDDEENATIPDSIRFPDSRIPNPGIFGPRPGRPQEGQDRLGMGYNHVL